jgi:arylsulfatase A
MAPYLYLRDDVPVGKPTVTKGWNRKGPATPEFDAVTCLADFARESRAFIRQGVAAKKPFFLYLPLTSPHTPIVPSERWIGKSGLGKYGDFVMETDWVIGEVLAELDAQGVADDTFVLFTCDNGCSPAAGIPDLVKQGHKPNADWRGHKADIYEGGHRVPFIVRWPSGIKAAQTTNALACLTDLYATMQDVTGQSPADLGGEDSFSLLPAFQGQPRTGRETLISHSIDGSFAIRAGDWKLCLSAGSGGWSDPREPEARKQNLPPMQLFDLKTDRGERSNLLGVHPDRVQSLLKLLNQEVTEGRCTPGTPVPNDRDVTFLPKGVSVPGLDRDGSR